MAVGLDALGGTGSKIVDALMQAGQWVLIAVIAVVVVGGALVGAWFAFRHMAYNIEANVYAKRQGSYVQIGRDRCKIKKTRARFFGFFGPVIQVRLHMLRRNVHLPAPNFDKLYNNDKRNSPGTLNFLKFGELDYALCDVEIVDIDGKGRKIKLVPIETDMKTWHLQEVQAARERNSPVDWLQRNQVLVISGLVIILFIVGIYGGYKYYDMLLNGAFSRFGVQIDKLADTLDRLNSCRV